VVGRFIINTALFVRMFSLHKIGRMAHIDIRNRWIFTSYFVNDGVGIIYLDLGHLIYIISTLYLYQNNLIIILYIAKNGRKNYNIIHI
jgi:hypothetical protein